MTNPLGANLSRFRTAGPVALSLVLLGAAWAEKVTFHRPPADTSAYHAAVKQAADLFPYNVGPWLGTDTESEMPEAAVRLLRKPEVVSRRYQNVRTGKVASLLIVHCKDARDLIGHYPPVCYPAHGWTKVASATTERRQSGGAIPVTDYRFNSGRIERAIELRIDNFMVLPDGQFSADMRGVEHIAKDYRLKFFGAAQVQLITDSTWSRAERDELFRELVSAAEPLLDTIRNGVRQ